MLGAEGYRVALGSAERFTRADFGVFGSEHEHLCARWPDGAMISLVGSGGNLLNSVVEDARRAHLLFVGRRDAAMPTLRPFTGTVSYVSQ